MTRLQSLSAYVSAALNNSTHGPDSQLRNDSVAITLGRCERARMHDRRQYVGGSLSVAEQNELAQAVRWVKGQEFA